MALAIGVAFDPNRLADDPLDRMTKAIEAWRDRFDNQPRRASGLFRRRPGLARPQDDLRAMAFENTRFSRAQRQNSIRGEIGPPAQPVLQRQIFANLARNGRSGQRKVAIHSRIGEDDPDSCLVPRAADRRQNCACLRRPKLNRGTRLKLINLSSDERIRGGDVLAEIKRPLGRKLEPASRRRTGEAALEAVFEAHRNENAVA